MAECITHQPMGKISSSGSPFRIALDSVGGKPFHTGVEPSLYATAKICRGGYLVATAFPDKQKVIVEPINDLDLASSNVALGTSFDPETLALLHFRSTFKAFEIAIKEEEKEGVITSVKLIVESCSSGEPAGGKKAGLHKSFLSYANSGKQNSNGGGQLRLPGGGGITNYAVHVHLFIGTSFGTFFICDGLRGSILSICRFVDWSPVEAAAPPSFSSSPAAVTGRPGATGPYSPSPSLEIAASAQHNARREGKTSHVDPQRLLVQGDSVSASNPQSHALGHPSNVAIASAASFSRSTRTMPLMMDSGSTMPPDPDHQVEDGTQPPSPYPLQAMSMPQVSDPHDYYYAAALSHQHSLTLNPPNEKAAAPPLNPSPSTEKEEEEQERRNGDGDFDSPIRHHIHSGPNSPLLRGEASGSSTGWTGYNNSSSPITNEQLHHPMVDSGRNSNVTAAGKEGGSPFPPVGSPLETLRSSEPSKLNSSHVGTASVATTRRPSSLENTFSLTPTPVAVHREHQEAVVTCIPCYSSSAGKSWNPRLLTSSSSSDSGTTAASSSSPSISASTSSPALQSVYVVHQNGYVVSLDREALDIFMSVAQKLAEEAALKYTKSTSPVPFPLSRPSLLDWNMAEAPSTIPCVGPASKFVTTITDVYDTDEVVSSSQNQFLNSLTNVFNPNTNSSGSRQRFQRMVLDAAIFESSSHGGEESVRKGRIDRFPALLMCGAQPSFTLNLMAHRDTSFGVRAVKAVTYMTGIATRVMKNMFGKSPAPTLPQVTPLEHKKLVLDRHFLDPRVTVTKTLVDPTQQWAALYAEDIHRLYLVDLVTGAVLRVMKGRRGIQFQWVMRTANGRQRVLLLVVQPERQLVELHDVQHTHRIAAGRIPAEAIMLPSPTTVDGTNGQDGSELLCLMPSGLVYRLSLDLETITLQNMKEEAAIAAATTQAVMRDHVASINESQLTSPGGYTIHKPELADHSMLLEVLKTCQRPEDFFDCAQNIPLPQYCCSHQEGEQNNNHNTTGFSSPEGGHELGDETEKGKESSLSSAPRTTVGLNYFVLYTQWMDQICEWIEWQFSPGKSASRTIPFVGPEPQRLPRTLTAGQTLNYLRKHTAVVRAYHALVAPPEPFATDETADDGCGVHLFADREIASVGMIPLVDEDLDGVPPPENARPGQAPSASVPASHIPHFTRTPSLVMNSAMRRVLKGLVPSRLINTPVLFPSPGLVAAEVLHKWGLRGYSGVERRGSNSTSEIADEAISHDAFWFKKKNMSFWKKCFVRVAHGLPGHVRSTSHFVAKNGAGEPSRARGMAEGTRVNMAMTDSSQDADVLLDCFWNHFFESSSASPLSGISDAEKGCSMMDLNAFLLYFYCGDDKQLLFLRHRIKREENETPGLDIYAKLGNLVFGQYGLSIFSHQIQPLTDLGMSMADIANLCVAWVAHACAEVGSHTFFASLSLGAFFSTFIVLSENALLNALESNPIDLVCHSKEQAQKSKTRLEALIMICMVRCLWVESQSKPADMFAFHLKFASASPSTSQKIGGRSHQTTTTTTTSSLVTDPFFLCLRRFLRLWELLHKYEALLIVPPRISQATHPDGQTSSYSVVDESGNSRQATTTTTTTAAVSATTSPTKVSLSSSGVEWKLRPLRLSLLHQAVPFSGAASSTTLEEYILEATGMDFERVFQMHECIARNSNGENPVRLSVCTKDEGEETEELPQHSGGSDGPSDMDIKNPSEGKEEMRSDTNGTKHTVVKHSMHYLQLAKLLFLCGAPAVFATSQPASHRSATTPQLVKSSGETEGSTMAPSSTSFPWLQVEGQWNRELFDMHVRKPLRAFWKSLSDDPSELKKRKTNKNGDINKPTPMDEHDTPKAEEVNMLGTSPSAVDPASSVSSLSDHSSASSSAHQFDQCCFFVALLGVVEQLVKPLEARLHTFWENSTIPSQDFLSVVPKAEESIRQGRGGLRGTDVPICLSGTRSMNDFFASLADMLLFILEVHRGIGLEKEGAQLSLTKTLSSFIVQDDHRVFTTVPSGLRDRLCILLSIVGENPSRIRQCTEQLMQLVNMIQFFMQSAQLQVGEMPLNLTDVHLPWKEIYGNMEELHFLRPVVRGEMSGGGGTSGSLSVSLASSYSKQRQNVVVRILRSFVVEGLILPAVEHKRAEMLRAASATGAAFTPPLYSAQNPGKMLTTENGRTVLLPLDYDDDIILQRLQSVEAYCVLAQLGSLLGMSENVAALVVLDFHFKHLVDIQYMDQQLVQERTNPACLRLVCTHLQMLLHAVYEYLLHHSEFIPQGTRRTYLVQSRKKVESTLSPKAKAWLKLNTTPDDASTESVAAEPSSSSLSHTQDGGVRPSSSVGSGNGVGNTLSTDARTPSLDTNKNNKGFLTVSSSVILSDDGIQWFTAEERREYTIQMQRMITARAIEKTERIKRTLLLLTNFAFDADERCSTSIHTLRNDIQTVADYIISVL